MDNSDNRWSDFKCYGCGQYGHIRTYCPQEQSPPAVTPPPQGAAYTRKDTIECPLCSRDWVAAFTSPTQLLDTLVCPWCRTFETRDGQPYRREQALRGAR